MAAQQQLYDRTDEGFGNLGGIEHVNPPGSTTKVWAHEFISGARPDARPLLGSPAPTTCGSLAARASSIATRRPEVPARPCRLVVPSIEEAV